MLSLISGATAAIGQFACRAGDVTGSYPVTVVDMMQRCDGTEDCQEGSDEWDCRELFELYFSETSCNKT